MTANEIPANAPATINILDHPILQAIPTASPTDSTPSSGPQLENDQTRAYTYPDVSDVNQQWYVPTVSVVAPSPGQAADGSPFSYSFRVAGHDQHGAPVIEATITATIQADPFDPTQAGPAASTAAKAVSFTSMVVSLAIPFRDSDTGLPTSTTLPSTTLMPITDVPSGTGWTATFDLTGDLARAAYGSLSTPNYQAQPTKLNAYYTFDVHQRRPFFIGIPFMPVTNPDDPLAPPPTDQMTVARTALARPMPLIAVQDDGTNLDAPTMGIQLQPTDPRPGSSLFVMGWRTIMLSRQLTVPLFVPCHDFGGLYLDATDPAHPQAVGCQDAIALGTAPSRLYRILDALTTDDYTVYASVGRASVYLLLPRRYRVGRTAPGSDHPAIPDYSPAIRWVQATDATHDAQLPCQLQASLVPDLTPAAMARLISSLAGQQLAGAPAPTVLLPTSAGAGLNSLSVASWNSGQQAVTSIDGDSIQYLAAMAWNDAVVFNANLQTGSSAAELVGNANFTLTDGQTLPIVELHVGIDDLAGPWPNGPVLVSAHDANSVTVQNNSTGTATIADVLAVTASGLTTAAGSVGTAVPPAGSLVIPLTTDVGADDSLVVDYTLSNDTGTIASQKVFLEDLHTTVTVVDSLDDSQWAKANLTQVDLTFRLDSDTNSTTVTMTPALPLIQIDIVQPLTGDRQQSNNLLHIGHVKHNTDGSTSAPVEIVVDLSQTVIFSLDDLLRRTS